MHEHFHAALANLDIPLLRKMWAHVSPNLSQPKSDEDALRQAHYARTIMDSMLFRTRAWSHAWLMERNLPSGLPDHLRPRAQRMYPITVGSVGIAVRGATELGRAVAPHIRGAMEDAVNEAYADGHKDEPVVVKGHMMEARRTAIKKLLG
jgi:hypothetical protein